MRQLLQWQLGSNVESKRVQESDHVNQRRASGFEATRAPCLDVLLSVLQTHVAPCPSKFSIEDFLCLCFAIPKPI